MILVVVIRRQIPRNKGRREETVGGNSDAPECDDPQGVHCVEEWDTRDGRVSGIFLAFLLFGL